MWMSPCDSLPPSGEHALSPSSVRGAVWCKTTDKGGMWLLSLSACLPPTLGAAITPWSARAPGAGCGRTSGSSFSRPAEGLFRWNLWTETTKNFKHGRRGTTNLSKPENSTELYLHSLDMWYFMAYGHHTLSVEHTLFFLSPYCVSVSLCTARMV